MKIPETSREYFAGSAPEECAGNLLHKSFTFFNVMGGNAYVDKFHKMWKAYHGVYSDNAYSDHQINFTGEQGELVVLPVNHFRNIAQHIYTMITSNRPSMDARPINTDYKSQAQTYLATGILDYYMREKGLEDAIKRAVEYGVVLGSGYIKMEWNATAGEAYDADPETGEFAYQGDIEFSNPSPLDVIFDGTKESWNHQWVMVRSFQNRFDLMAKYPEKADTIKGIPSKRELDKYSLQMFTNDDTDDIAVYEFFHKPTEALPDGRYMLFVSTECVLLDTKMPYRRIPVFRIAPGTFLGTSYGYTPMFDIFPIQQCINSIYSSIMTNQNAFGVHNLYVPRNANFNVNNLDGGLNIIEADAKPEVLQLLATPQESFKFLEMLIQAAETISGVNSVARGNPEASLRSGSSLALVQSMALQFISGFQQSYVKLVEDTGTGLLDILKDFAHTPRLVALVGKNNKPLLKEFTGEDITQISRVIVDLGNPLARTIAGRVQMAEQMLQMKLIKNPQQYFQVIEGGKLETMFEGDMSELFLIKRENENMLEGKPVITSIYDAHRIHIMEHKSLASDPDVRLDVGLMEQLNRHIQEHIDMLRTVDPDLLALLGEQPLQPMPQQGQPPGPAQPSSQSMESGNIEQMMQPEGGVIQPGEPVGPVSNPTQSVPGLPKPPAPFQDSPVLPGDEQ